MFPCARIIVVEKRVFEKSEIIFRKASFEVNKFPSTQDLNQCLNFDGFR